MQIILDGKNQLVIYEDIANVPKFAHLLEVPPDGWIEKKGGLFSSSAVETSMRTLIVNETSGSKQNHHLRNENKTLDTSLFLRTMDLGGSVPRLKRIYDLFAQKNFYKKIEFQKMYSQDLLNGVPTLPKHLTRRHWYETAPELHHCEYDLPFWPLSVHNGCYEKHSEYTLLSQERKAELAQRTTITEASNEDDVAFIKKWDDRLKSSKVLPQQLSELPEEPADQK